MIRVNDIPCSLYAMVDPAVQKDLKLIYLQYPAHSLGKPQKNVSTSGPTTKRGGGVKEKKRFFEALTTTTKSSDDR